MTRAPHRAEEERDMKVYKGTDKDMKCREMQYELGKTHEFEGELKCCESGLHSCKAPFDVLKYYGLLNGNRYFEAEAEGKIAEDNRGDSKIASSRLTIRAEIGLPGLIKAQAKYTREMAERGGKNGDDSNLAGGDDSNLAGGDDSNLAGGDDSNLAGGDGSNLAGGDGSNLAGGLRSNLAGGESALIVGRNECRAKGGLNSVLVLTEWEWSGDEYKPVAVKAEIVDGERIKADTWYELKNGEFAEAEANK